MRALVIASAAALTSGCGAAQPAPQAVSAPAISSAPTVEPAPSQPVLDLHREWSADIRNDKADLYFGFPNSGDIAVTMECTPGSGRTSISTQNTDIPVIELVSGGVSEALPAAIHRPPDWDADVTTLKDADLNAPVLLNFRRTGDLKLRQPDRDATALTSEERDQIESFFAVCASALAH